MSLKVTQKAAVALFEALGMPMAAKWTAERLAEKLLKVPSTVDEDTDVKGENKKLLDAIIKAVKDEEKIKVVEGEEPTKKKSKDEDEDEDEAPKKSKKSKSDEDDEDDDDDDDEPKKKKKDKDGKKKAFGEGAGGPGKPGVIASIEEFLRAADEENPISKKKLGKKLKERFPDRELESMLRTVHVQVPNRLKADKGIKVSSNDDGYWIDPKKQKSKDDDE